MLKPRVSFESIHTKLVEEYCLELAVNARLPYKVKIVVSCKSKVTKKVATQNASYNQVLMKGSQYHNPNQVRLATHRVL